MPNLKQFKLCFKWCKGLNKGFYIDLGEFGPQKTSTTKYFYLKGWSGINIEPLRKEYENLLTKTNFMFCDCNYIVNIDLTNFKSEKVINMCGMFMNCNSLTYINLSNLSQNS